MYRVQMISRKDQLCKHLFRNTVTSVEAMKTVFTIDDMPQPKSLPIIGTKIDLYSAGGGTKLHEYIDFRHKQLGPIFCEKLGGSANLVFISDPLLMKSLFLNLEGKYPAHILPDPWVLYEKLYGSKRGLFFMDGEEWLCNRRIMNKHLLLENSEKWLRNPINETIQKYILNWKGKSDKSNFSLNLESELYRLSTDVIIAVLLGSNTTLKCSKNYEMLLLMFSDSVKKIFQTTTKLYALPVSICQRLNLKVWRDFKDCVDMSLALAKKIVTEMLNTKANNNGLINRLCKENISDETITRIVADFVIAAGDTTAFTSLWTLLLISKHINVKADLNIHDLSYVKYVVKESMRLYPVAPFLTRILQKECILGSYRLHAGTPVIASIYTSGRDEQNFSQADKFLPYRWDRNDPRKADLVNHVPSASLPFALGARSCIGKKIAMLQLTELISQIVHNFDIECVNDTEVKPITSQVLVPDRNIEIKFSLREN